MEFVVLDLDISERLIDALEQFLVGKMAVVVCILCNFVVKKSTFLLSCLKFWPSNGSCWLKMMDSWKHSSSFMKLISFLEIRTEMYAIV